jgi:hypothetical protein
VPIKTWKQGRMARRYGGLANVLMVAVALGSEQGVT